MSSGVMFVGETPESAFTRAAVESLVIVCPQACRKAIRTIIGKQLRDTIGAFRKGATPGGPTWAAASPAWTEFKRTILGQNPVMVGIYKGDLRQSIASDVNEAALEGRVGSSNDHAQYFHDGPPERRFLPTIELASKEAAATASRILSAEIRKKGLRITQGITGADLEDLL